jgi:proton glutamate symport protein
MKNSILIKVFIAIILAVIAGMLTGSTAEIYGVKYLQIYSLIGQLFLNALTLVVLPLVASSIITGTARMGAEEAVGTLGVKTIGYFVLNLMLGVTLGMFLALTLSPGKLASDNTLLTSIAQNTNLELITSAAQGNTFEKLEQIFFKIIPPNIIAAAAQGQMLGLIFFCLVFGYFISKIESQASSIILGFWKGIFEIMMKMTTLIMKALPLGVFGLVAKVVATSGFEAIRSVGLFTVTVLLGLTIHSLIVLPLILKFVGRVNPIAHIRAMAPALFTCFCTSSSLATLPVTIECLEKKSGVSNRICSFTIPLGTSLNNVGSTIFVSIASIFIAQVYGLPLSVPQLITIFLMTILASLGTAGIPSSCLVGLMVVLNSLGLPADGIALVLAVERLLDMCRTVANIYGNASCTVLIARADGEKDILLAPVAATPG